MNDSEIKNEPAAENPVAPAPESLEQQVAALQRQVSWLLLVLLLVSGTLCVFLWRQSRVARKDLQEMFKGPAGQIIQAFQQDKPRMDAFVSKVAEYGKTHSDFAPIMDKYKIQISTNPPAAGGAAAPKPPAPAAPAPAAPAAAPKK